MTRVLLLRVRPPPLAPNYRGYMNSFVDFEKVDHIVGKLMDEQESKLRQLLADGTSIEEIREILLPKIKRIIPGSLA
jgi:hypothetical protein